MRHVFSQIIILVLFLFLAAFASIWYNDSSPAGEAERSQTFLWLSQAAQKSLAFIGGLTTLSFSPLGPNSASYSDNINSVEEEAGGLIQDAPSIYQNLSQSEKQIIANEAVSKNDFQEFTHNFFAKVPEMYLNVKTERSGWQEFWSWCRFKYQDLRPE